VANVTEDLTPEHWFDIGFAGLAAITFIFGNRQPVALVLFFVRTRLPPWISLGNESF
jgi:hypothetical protein